MNSGSNSTPWRKMMRQRVVDLCRQWPWIFPRGIESSVARWVERSQRRNGWYVGLRRHWHEPIHEGGLSVRVPPAELPPAGAAAFDQVSCRRYPATSVSFLAGGYIVGDQGLVLTPDHRVLAEFYHEFGVRSIRRLIYSQPFSTARWHTDRESQPVALLAAPQGRNHYHWLLDVVPRLALLSRWRGVIRKYAVPEGLADVQLEMLEAFGIRPDQLLTLTASSRVRCQALFVPSLPGSEGSSPPWVKPFLHDALAPVAAGTPGQGAALYLSRGANATRPVLNEDLLIERLRRRGFVIVHPDRLSLRAQIALFRDARLVVAAHGAALANLVFSRQVAVLELLSADYPRADCYFTLCAESGFPYDCWYDAQTASPAKPWGGIVVDVDDVERRIDRLSRRLP